MWQNSDKIIILHFRPFGCGKFVSNVLSFNDNFVPQMYLVERFKKWNSDVKVLDNLETFDESFLKEYKIKQIFDTIPPTKHDCRKWGEYELGCQMFWNFRVPEINERLPLVQKSAINILTKGFYCFMVSHNDEEVKLLKNIFKNARVIQIINDHTIREMSVKLKLDPKDSGILNQTPLDEDNDHIKFDIDYLFDQNMFFKQITRTMEQLDITDKSLDPRVHDFYKKYTDLYK